MLKKIFAFLFIVAALAVPSARLNAAQAPLTLEPGRVYAFTSADRRTISYITLTGTEKYEYAAQNAEGQTVDYGTSAGRVPVRGGGVTYVSAAGTSPITAAYDGAKISYTEEEGRALHNITLKPGETAELTNNHFEQISVKAVNAGGYSEYDAVVRDSRGDVTYFARAVKLPMQNIPASCKATITAGADGLTLVVPAVWVGNELSVTQNYASALTERALTAGKAVTIQNANTDRAYEPKIFMDGGIFSYDYLLKDVKGYTLKTETGIKGDRLTINASNTLTVTPAADGALLYYPADWAGDLLINGAGAGAPSVTDETYEVSSTLVITNTDPEETHSVQIYNKQADSDYTFDYALTDADGITYKWEFYANTFAIPPTGVLSITPNKNQTLVVKLPSASGAVTAATSGVPALEFIAVPEGKTIALHSTHFGEYPITPRKDVKPGVWDYILRNEADEVMDYGGINLGEIYPLNQNETLRFTNTEDFDAQVVFPAQWLEDGGIAYTFSNTPSLYRVSVTEGNALMVRNARPNYSEEFKIEAVGEKPSAYDFMHTMLIGSKNGLVDILEYGVAEAGIVKLYPYGYVTVSPQEDCALSICYPYELSARWVKVTEATAPVRHITLKPGEMVTFANYELDEEFIIQNDSETSQAAYYLRKNDEPRQIKKTDVSSKGLITIPADTLVTVIAADGADLELWLPELWAKKMLK